MANKYHISEKLGMVRLCKAEDGNCPVSPQNEHYTTLTEAENALDKKTGVRGSMARRRRENEKRFRPYEAGLRSRGYHPNVKVKEIDDSGQIKVWVEGAPFLHGAYGKDGTVTIDAFSLENVHERMAGFSAKEVAESLSKELNTRVTVLCQTNYATSDGGEKTPGGYSNWIEYYEGEDLVLPRVGIDVPQIGVRNTGIDTSFYLSGVAGILTPYRDGWDDEEHEEETYYVEKSRLQKGFDVEKAQELMSKILNKPVTIHIEDQADGFPVLDPTFRDD